MAVVRELLTRWGFDVDINALERFDDQVGALRTKVNTVGQNLDAVATGARAFGTRLSAFVTLPLVGAAGAALKLASDAEEIDSKFATVFASVSKNANTASKDLARNYGLSSSSAKELLSDTGDLLTGFGFTGESALNLSTQVQQLAVDLASFTNFSGGAQGASQALTKALLGERESVKSLGISILEEDVKKKVAELRTQGLTFATERQAKAEATLRIAMEQSKNAIGDYARTSSGFANRLRATQQRAKDVAIAFGRLLLPAGQKLLDMTEKLLNWFEDLDDGTRSLILTIGGIAAVVGPLVLLFGILGGIILSAVKTFTLFKGAITLLKTMQLSAMLFNASVLLIPALVLAVAAAIGLLVDDILAWRDGQESVFGVLLERFPWLLDAFKTLKEIAGAAFNVISSGFNLMTSLLEAAWEGWKLLGGIIYDYVLKPWIDTLDTMFGGISRLTSFLGGGLSDVLNSFAEGIDTATASLRGATGLDTVGATVATGGVNGLASPAAVAQSIAPAQSNKNSVKVNASINVAVPEGTAEEQKRVVQDAARDAAEEVFNTKVRQLAGDHPEVE